MTRPDRLVWCLAKARLAAARSTCARRAVGCVLVDARGVTLAEGHNGVPAGFPHCAEGPRCPGAGAESGRSLDECAAIHAEQNAVAFCPAVDRVATAYVTVEPCVGCAKLLLQTSAGRVVALEAYPGRTGRELWERAGRVWVVVGPEVRAAAARLVPG